MKRVVITGLGAMTPLGNSVAAFWQNIVAGKSGAGSITKFDAANFKTRFACEVRDFNPDSYLARKDQRKYDLFTQYAVAAADQAIADSGIDLEAPGVREQTGVIWASGNGGISTFEQELKEYNAGNGTPHFNPYFIPKIIADIAAGVISIRHKLYGPNYCTVSACASSNTAIINALDTIRLGRATVMIAGGSEAAITQASVGGFNASKALSQRNDDPGGASRPFDKLRDGFVLGEGAGALVLEEYHHAIERGATIYAEIAGGGMAADAYHLTGTSPQGTGAQAGMRQALKDAGLAPEQIGYINAHATATGIGDASELVAISEVFKQVQVPVSATKSMTGHLLGAAGAVEAIICIKALQEGILPATINTTEVEEGLPYAANVILGHAMHRETAYILSNTFGFGGHTASIIFKRYTA